MTVLLDATFPRTVDELAAEPGCTLEAWVFEDAATRRATEARLAAAGVRARLRSAYKPLLHAFLEEVELSGLSEVVVRLPSHPLAVPGRFSLEAYPLAGLLHGATLRLEPGDLPLEHEVLLRHGTRESRLRVFAPNRERRTPHGAAVLCPCGWVRVWRDGAPPHDAPVETEHERAHAAVLGALAAHPWGEAEPLFEVLRMEVGTGGIEHRLPVGDECPSTRESLHEDLYFGALELFGHRAGHPLGFRGLRPGQIVPEVRRADGPTRVRVTLAPPDPDPPVEGAQDLATATRPLDATQVADELRALGGEPFAVRSRQGRAVPGTVLAGDGPGLVVTAGQHANEPSGVVGALRAARTLCGSGLRLAVVPLENPDGYALHARLRRDNPRHMHHAARYTALGDDLEHRPADDPGERAARLEAFRRTGVRLHLSLHGYPAHEWTRPLAGYLPPAFEGWTVPRGFFLIMRHHPGLAAAADGFVRTLAARLDAAVPGLRPFNAAQEALRAAHAGPSPFPLLSGIPVVMTEHATQVPPFVLVTEYPDETVYDDAFRLAHDTQTATVLEAASLLRTGLLG